MCGIIGYTGHRPAVPVIMDGLRRLEYRGYDSAGLAFVEGHRLRVLRAEGKLAALDACLEGQDCSLALFGIGHTRWATHGLPVVRNAHPHQDASGRFALVHNGIIENYAELKAELQAQGVAFVSDTDTEVLVQLLAREVTASGDVRRGIAAALARVEGAYAFALIDRESPGVVWAGRQASPLVLGVGVGEHFVASDIPAFLPFTRDVVFLDDGDVVEMRPDAWTVFDARTLAPRDKAVARISWDVQAAQKGGFKHFMLKEILEQPRVVRDAVAGRVRGGSVVLPELEGLARPERLVLVACGTSWHAGLWGRYLMESMANIPTQVEVASEFRYGGFVVRPSDTVLVISQSGETADTLAALRMARQAGAAVLGVCNVVGSSIAREAQRVLYTQAGPEISVASTKAMTSQMLVLLLLALHWGRERLAVSQREAILHGLSALPEILEATLPGLRHEAQSLAREYAAARGCFYLGRGPMFPLALEGALKLKEISYIHAEGYAAGEMKHGPIALVDPEFPSVAVCLRDELLPKMRSNLQEVAARGGRILAITNPGVEIPATHVWTVPEVPAPLGAFMVLPALQLFAYEVAVYLGCDVDQPRNLAKSVTVE
ncbi:MAG: glutamine--fructose-6-phosphate transaminase (isomerizing) [Desulfomicrobiaceae bacterium]|nr:glutamine--fructose-6-phosphate transaminase (isomerizing) [Desulfomicrobiaceae bacterium]